ncbi:MAG: hypothetical protein WA945_09925 [Arcobacteraceae bacterium]
MIKTKFNISIEIDDKPFSISVQEPTKKQVEEMQEVSNKYKGEYEKLDASKNELKEAQNEFDINKQILEYGKVTEKASVWMEQKKLNKKIFTLKPQITESERTITSISKMIEELLEKRFDLLVGGADKTSLKKECDDKGISFETIIAAIGKLVEKQKEKK